ncbi:hypothetical protein BH09ACT8_BH09ACT8_22960 [soil metagenome]
MALSDQLSKLSVRAKSLEDSAVALQDKNKAWVERREAELRASLDNTRSDVAAAASAESDDVHSGWAKLQQSVSEGFTSMKKSSDINRAEFRAKRADREADDAELDAEDAIEFAVYALQEAEYYVVAAADARLKSDDVALESEVAQAD